MICVAACCAEGQPTSERRVGWKGKGGRGGREEESWRAGQSRELSSERGCRAAGQGGALLFLCAAGHPRHDRQGPESHRRCPPAGAPCPPQFVAQLIPGKIHGCKWHAALLRLSQECAEHEGSGHRPNYPQNPANNGTRHCTDSRVSIPHDPGFCRGSTHAVAPQRAPLLLRWRAGWGVRGFRRREAMAAEGPRGQAASASERAGMLSCGAESGRRVCGFCVGSGRGWREGLLSCPLLAPQSHGGNGVPSAAT